MSGYHLYVLHSRLVSREHAVWAWEEADRIEARTLQAGVLDALREIGWIVDVDDSEVDYGLTRWLLWVKDVNDVKEMVAGTPLGYLDLLKPKSLDLEDDVATREWRERVRVARGDDPKPPAPGNLLERLLEKMPQKELIERLDDPDFGDAEKILATWAMYRDQDQAVRAGDRRASAELRDSLLAQLLRSVQDIRDCNDAQARLAAPFTAEWLF